MVLPMSKRLTEKAPRSAGRSEDHARERPSSFNWSGGLCAMGVEDERERKPSGIHADARRTHQETSWKGSGLLSGKARYGAEGYAEGNRLRPKKDRREGLLCEGTLHA